MGYLLQYFWFDYLKLQFWFTSIFWIGLMSSLLLKPQIPAFTVPQLSEAMDVILQRAHELKVIIFLIPLPVNHGKVFFFFSPFQLPVFVAMSWWNYYTCIDMTCCLLFLSASTLIWIPSSWIGFTMDHITILSFTRQIGSIFESDPALSYLVPLFCMSI